MLNHLSNFKNNRDENFSSLAWIQVYLYFIESLEGKTPQILYFYLLLMDCVPVKCGIIAMLVLYRY